MNLDVKIRIKPIYIAVIEKYLGLHSPKPDI
jgi:hypothetical protein